MRDNWSELPLKDVCLGIYDCPHSTPNLSDTGPYMVRTQDIRQGFFDTNSAVHVSEEVYLERTKRVEPVKGDLLFSREGTYFGDAAEVPRNFRVCLGQRMVLIRPNPKVILASYLRIQINSPSFQVIIRQYRDGTVAERLNLPVIRKLMVKVPPMDIQDYIISNITCLDDKIDLNRRMNATLEGMAQALFKSWFVDFDPVIDNALAAGNPIPEELAERAEVRRKALADGTTNCEAAKPFPAAFQLTEEMGWIPEGWEVRPLGNTLRSVSDTYPLKTVEEVIFLNTGDILDGKFLHQDISGTTGLPGQAKKSIRKDDILYSEIRPKNRRFAYVYFDSPKYVVSTKLMVLRATSDVSSMFSYLILKQDSTINYLQLMAESRSGTFPQITFDILSKIEVALPQEPELITAFTETILTPIFQKQIRNDAISENLTKLRDTLLPKLISGELRIPDAEKLTEEEI